MLQTILFGLALYFSLLAILTIWVINLAINTEDNEKGKMHVRNGSIYIFLATLFWTGVYHLS